MTTKSLKVILLGNTNVGKSSIIYYFINGSFNPNITNSVGSGHFEKTLNVESQEIELIVWDTAGQEKYKSVTPMFARGANVCIFVADVTSIDSFRDIKEWRELLNTTNPDSKMILAVNKIDLNPDLQKDVERKSNDDNNDQQFAERDELLDEIRSLFNEYPNYVWVSALNGTGINDLFNLAAQMAFNDEDNRVVITPIESDENKQKCC